MDVGADRTRTTAAFAERLRAGMPQLGSFVFSPDPAHCEIIGGAGFDFAIIDMEHAPLSEMHVLNQVRAAAGSGVAPLVRIGAQDPRLVARLLDLGAAGIVIPHAGTDLEETVRLCRAMRYPPAGWRPACRGVRAAGYGSSSFDSYVRLSDQTVLSFGLIEDMEAVNDIDRVIAECGFDVVMPGPNDLASSLGLHGQLDHPKVRAVMEQVLDAVRRSGTARAAMYVENAAAIPQWRAKGVSIFVLSIDYRLLIGAYARSRQEASAIFSVM